MPSLNPRIRTPLAALAGPLLLAACASTPAPTFHTLNLGSALAQQAPAAYAIEVVPVSIPPQVDQPQLMLRNADGQVLPMYGERWAAPLADEIRSALAERLSHRLGAPDVTQIGAGGLPVWRVQVDVQRFDLALGEPVALDLIWRVRELPNRPPLLCASRLRVTPESADVAASVAAQRQALALASDIVANAIAAGGKAPTGAQTQASQTQCSASPAPTPR